MRCSVLDSDITSEILKRRDDTVLRNVAAYARSHRVLTVTSVTVHEIVFGLSRRLAVRQLEEARRIFAENEVVVPKAADYERSAVVRATAERRGRLLTFNDCLVGATAERLGLPVATGNTAHFQAMIDAGLRIELENWRRLGPPS